MPNSNAPRRFPVGVFPIVVATAIAGGAGYVVNLAVPLRAAPTTYAQFSILWSVLYFCLAALGGVQQEVTRATRPVSSRTAQRNPLAAFTAIGATAIAVIVLALGTVFLPVLLGHGLISVAVPIAIAAGSYVVVGVLSGILSGIQRWRWVATMIALDGMLRLVAIAIVLAAGGGLLALVWAVALPFPLVPALVWLIVRRRIEGASVLDVGVRALVWNNARTLAAAAASGVLITGFPVLLAATSIGVPTAHLAGINLAVNLVRAPLVVVVLALQGYLVVQFRGGGARALRLVARVAAAIAAVSVLLAVLAAVLGPTVFRLFGAAYALHGWFFGLLVLASGFLGVLCVGAAYLLSVGRHGAYLTAWGVAAAVTVVVLLLPLELEVRAIIGLVAGPLVGIAAAAVMLRGPRSVAV